MKMVDKIEMSLDEIIKQTKGVRVRGGGGRRGRGAGSSPRRGARRTQRPGGGVMRGRNRGGITRASLPYTRVRTLRHRHVPSDYRMPFRRALSLTSMCMRAPLDTYAYTHAKTLNVCVSERHTRVRACTHILRLHV